MKVSQDNSEAKIKKEELESDVIISRCSWLT